MLVLIATDELQGTAPDDHHCAVDGELVIPEILDCPDRHCDLCRRGWFGLVSLGVTTTAMVVDRPGVTIHDLQRRIHDWLDRTGVIDRIVQAVEAGCYQVDGVGCDDPVVAVGELVDAHVDEVIAICRHFPVGATVSRLGTLVSERHLARAA